MFSRIALSSMIVLLFLGGALVAQDATYQIRFDGDWTSNLPRPGSAHFSPLIGATHQAPGAIFSPGTLASRGVENVAELGSNGVLISEINNGIANGSIGGLITRSGNVGPEQITSFNISVSEDHSLLTLLTMIAPSPDWFVGVHDLDLQDANGNWRPQVTVNLNSYDAGTENGNNLSLNNSPTVPQGVIAMLDAAVPNGALFGAGPIARMTITRVLNEPETVVPGVAEVTRGNLRSGGSTQLASSDNADLSAFRNPADFQPRIDVEVEAFSPVVGPTTFDFTLEASVFARGNITQIIQLWNFDSQQWEQIDSRNAARNVDSVTTVSAPGVLDRFVEQESGMLRARIRYQSSQARQLFSANMDQAVWTIQ